MGHNEMGHNEIGHNEKQHKETDHNEMGHNEIGHIGMLPLSWLTSGQERPIPLARRGQINSLSVLVSFRAVVTDQSMSLCDMIKMTNFSD